MGSNKLDVFLKSFACGLVYFLVSSILLFTNLFASIFSFETYQDGVYLVGLLASFIMSSTVVGVIGVNAKKRFSWLHIGPFVLALYFFISVFTMIQMKSDRDTLIMYENIYEHWSDTDE